MSDRTEEHKQRLLERLRASPTLKSEDGLTLTGWIVLSMQHGIELSRIELLVGEAQRIISAERVERQIESNLRQTFGARLDHLSYVELTSEYRDFSTSDMAGNNDARFFEWLGLEETSNG